MLTEKEIRAVMVTRAKREGYVTARIAMFTGPADEVRGQFEREAELLYPLPVTPRAVIDPLDGRRSWRVSDGSLECRSFGSETWMRWSYWRGSPDAAPLRERVALWAELYANPNEVITSVIG